jgi:hypothetical protein
MDTGIYVVMDMDRDTTRAGREHGHGNGHGHTSFLYKERCNEKSEKLNKSLIELTKPLPRSREIRNSIQEIPRNFAEIRENSFFRNFE